MRNLLLLSNSTVHGTGYLMWAESHIKDFFLKKNVSKLLFVPYALHDLDDYTKTVSEAFEKWGIAVEGIHCSKDPVAAVEKAQAIFIGGGNTFRLLKRLMDNSVLEPIRRRVLEDGVPYMGSSAGTNVSTVSICTTNDMPIVYPPSFTALRLVDFNINPHYIDPPTDTKHMGETREQRIVQYHEMEGSSPVLGMREGSLLHVKGGEATLYGDHTARLFVKGEEPKELPTGDVSFLLSI